MANTLKNIVVKNISGEQTGIYSICSANEFVINASVNFAKKNDTHLLVEATSNQVDQFGGYTGMTPRQFADKVRNIAREMNFPEKKLILGGDHLGPNRWKNLNISTAMENAKVQIRDYVKAGFTKIHLDTSMSLGGEKTNSNGLLDAKIVAERAAELCSVAEKASSSASEKPVYIIGTDVPIPGGAITNEEDIRVTKPAELEETISVTKEQFVKRNLEDAWERVIAVVVQPGVEFSDTHVFEYNPKRAKNLVKKILNFEGIAFEAHSTDYQRAENLWNMVKDNFAILKVGPWLTFALREALFGLELIERELFPVSRRSNLRMILEQEMEANPQYWIKHYKGTKKQKQISRIYSYSDRIRYYWAVNKVEKSVEKLMRNLSSKEIPLTLISQFLPNQYRQIRNGELQNDVQEIIFNKVEEVLSIYKYAVGQ